MKSLNRVLGVLALVLLSSSGRAIDPYPIDPTDPGQRQVTPWVSADWAYLGWDGVGRLGGYYGPPRAVVSVTDLEGKDAQGRWVKVFNACLVVQDAPTMQWGVSLGQLPPGEYRCVVACQADWVVSTVNVTFTLWGN